MKIIFKNNKKIFGVFCIVIGFILLIIGLRYTEKKDKITQIEESIEHIFFYLPNEEYSNLNEISDYCKISLVYGTNYLKEDAYLSSDNYNTIVKRKKNSVKGYKISNVLKAVQEVLGKNATINFEKNEDDDYEFLIQDSCKFGNKKLQTLNYNESSKYIYSLEDENIENNTKLHIKWDKPIIEDDNVILTAKALLSIKNNNGGYDIYRDKNLSYKIKSINNNNEYNILKLYDESNTYKFVLKKENDNYIWIKYEVINNIEDEVIYD